MAFRKFKIDAKSVAVGVVGALALLVAPGISQPIYDHVIVPIRNLIHKN